MCLVTDFSYLPMGVHRLSQGQSDSGFIVDERSCSIWRTFPADEFAKNIPITVICWSLHPEFIKNEGMAQSLKIELYLRDCDFCDDRCMSTAITFNYCPWEFIDCSTAILISELLWMNVLVLLNEYSLPMNWWRIFWWWLFVDRYILSLCKKLGVRPKP